MFYFEIMGRYYLFINEKEEREFLFVWLRDLGIGGVEGRLGRFDSGEVVEGLWFGGCLGSYKAALWKVGFEFYLGIII